MNTLAVGGRFDAKGRPDLSGKVTGIAMRDGAEPRELRSEDWRQLDALTVLTPTGFRRVTLSGPFVTTAKH